jgi:hypothetical protein
LRDGVPMTRDEVGLPVPVDPGDHAVVVTSPGHPTRTFTAHLGPEAPDTTIRIDSLDEPSTPPVPVPIPPPEPAPAPRATPLPVTPEPLAAQTSDPGRTRRYVGLGVGAIGVVGIGVGSAFGIIAKQKFDQSNSSQCSASTDRCYAPGFPMRKDAEQAATVSDVSFAIGAVLLVTGAIVYFTAPKSVSATSVVVAPAPMVGGGGALLHASF